MTVLNHVFQGKKGDGKCNEGDKKTLLLTLHDTKIRTDAASLVAHHIRRQAGLQPEDRTRMHHLLRAVFPRLLNFEPPTNVDFTDTLDTKENIGRLKSMLTSIPQSLLSIFHRLV